MRPNFAFALAFFCIQWVLNARINYDIETNDPDNTRRFNTMPRFIVDRYGPSFSFLLSLFALTLVLAFILLARIQGLIVFILGLLLINFNFHEKWGF